MLSKSKWTLRRPKKTLDQDLLALVMEFKAEQAKLPNSLVRTLYLESNKEYKAAEKLRDDLKGKTVIYTDEDFTTLLSAKFAKLLDKHKANLPQQYVEQLHTHKSHTPRNKR